MNSPQITSYQSPSGTYRLDVSDRDNPGGWRYCRGQVWRQDHCIAVVDRNIGGFPFLFVESHPNGHDYLICGEDYQGQTVIELDTGRRIDELPPEAEDGMGFCWAEARYLPELEALLVLGCYWACPYEYRLYDFRDPMTPPEGLSCGWPLITLEDEEAWLDADEPWPILCEDNTLLYQQLVVFEPGQEAQLAATQRFERRGLTLALVESWIDPREVERRAQALAARLAREKEWADYKATDPLFARVLGALQSVPGFNEGAHFSVGTTHERWHPTQRFEDARVCVRLADRVEVNGVQVTLDLEWGKLSAPIKLQPFHDGEIVPALWFEHSVEAMDEALARAAAFLRVS